MPTVALHTLGCRLNQAETAIIANKLKQKGFEIVDFGQKADLTIINTCTVTEQADAKCRHAVRQSLRKNPDSFVAVIGCYAQMAVDVISQIQGVDLIMGNEHKMLLDQYLDENLQKQAQPLVVHSSKISRQPFVIESIGLYDNYTRANLKIQDGCSFVCSFCIIATARGPARSREFEDLLKEANELVNLGFKEIVLTGVNIGTYRYADKEFLDILRALEKIEGLERIRISSIEPTTVTRELIDFMADSSKVCRHLHIPLQSADDRILKLMRRKHTFAEFEQIINYAVQRIPEIGLGTDIMVGFPTEDDAAFVNTKKRVADLPLAYFHVFTYSERKGTAAFKMKPKVHPEVKKWRNRVMIEMGQRKKFTFYQKFLGKTMPVLFEQPIDGYWEGFTDNYMRVKVKSTQNLKNELVQVTLKEIEGDKIIGELS